MGRVDPEADQELQWTRLLGGKTSAVFCERVKVLLGRWVAGGEGIGTCDTPACRDSAEETIPAAGRCGGSHSPAAA